MKSDPTDASAPFNLGNMLRGASRTVEAEAALRAATRANPAFAEAWYNLADLLDDQGRSEAAVECLRKVLLVAPDYIDAMFNLALLLQRKGGHAEAADYWRRYLASDRSSEWAARARRSLKFCEIQVNSIACGSGSGAPSTDLTVTRVTGHKSCVGRLPQALIKGPQAFPVQLFSRRCGKFAITNDSRLSARCLHRPF
jgi:tetratricopeptide (TPR) repeat protein